VTAQAASPSASSLTGAGERTTELDSNDTMGRVLLPKVEGVLELAS
jgi:hypothetical protein